MAVDNTLAPTDGKVATATFPLRPCKKWPSSPNEASNSLNTRRAMGKQLAADGGDAKVARVAIEQARAQRGLCLPNGSAECRLRHAHLQACAPKTARLHDVDEGLQLRQRKVDLAHAIDPFLLSHI